jgi:hypothetical protein
LFETLSVLLFTMPAILLVLDMCLGSFAFAFPFRSTGLTSRLAETRKR